MPAGRPTDYNDEIVRIICGRIAEGTSLRKVCKEEGMPNISSVFNWLSEHPEFLEQYTRSRESQADVYFDEAMDIADDASNDWMETNDPNNAGWRINGECLARSRLRIDTRKWVAGKLRPKKYGEKIIQEQTGPDGGPIQVESVVKLDDLTAEQRGKLKELLEDVNK